MTQPNPASANGNELAFAPPGLQASSLPGRSIDLVRFVLSIWKWLALGLFAGLTLGVVSYLIMGPVYRASTRVQVSKKASLPINSQEARRYSDRSQHVHFLTSDAIAAIAIEKYGLKDIPGIANARDPLKAVWEDATAKLVSGQDQSFDAIIEVAYESADKAVAKTVVEAIVKAYEDWLGQTKDKNSADLYAALQGSRTALIDDISKMEAAWKAWRDASPYFYPTPPVVTVNGVATPQMSPQAQALDRVIREQESIQTQRANVQGKIATLKKMIAANESPDEIQFWVMHALSAGTGGGAEGGGGGGGGGGGVLQGPSGKAELDGRLLAARLVESRLSQLVGDNHADLKNVRSEITTILSAYRSQGIVAPTIEKEDLAAVAQGAAAKSGNKKAGVDLPHVYLYILESQLEEFKIREDLLAARRTEAEGTAKESSLFDAADQKRKDEIAAKQKELESVRMQIADYNQSRSQEGYKVSQLSQVRIERSLKQVLKVFGACGLLGLISVFALAYVREWYDTSVRSVDEVRQLTGAHVLGIVPHFQKRNQNSAMAHTGISPQVVYLHHPGSRESEAYRSLRTTLFFSTRETGEKVIQVCSAEPGDGKSTTTANLAVALAQSGKSVVLIDADLRRPTVHDLFALPRQLGLAEVLTGAIPLESGLKATPVANLSVLTAGIPPENPAELLSTSNLEGLVQELRGRYDFVLFDSPPVLAVSDPCIIAPQADAMLLVVRLEKNNRTVLRRACEQLDAHGIRLLGVIANDAAASTQTEGSYGNYEEYYSTAPATSGGAARSKAAAGKLW
ncbi:polysaccharide biosynthesis tyrosine autokinase [Planctomyces sp. SH-PL14]|uniref:polysaccharide biosynthesis tyrosine autokinase n=1 Tax=Planctomyces sp. SH-PL14 TaxID=1632864 RepID=UPI00078B86B1|nr:polysaccharide biosynthesis tyrosine autokinase [Planctomyces sp. SH-PL14]AMV17718.1 Tyrosine-protein kinase YwqD [Planctomyces sp. SH-PL14]